MPDDSPAPLPQEEEDEEEEEQSGTGNAALDGILSHAQQSMLDAIASLGKRVDAAIEHAGDTEQDVVEEKRSASSALS